MDRQDTMKPNDDEPSCTHSTKSAMHGNVVAGGDPWQEVHVSVLASERVTEKPVDINQIINQMWRSRTVPEPRKRLPVW